jgi:hypothetical protein
VVDMIGAASSVKRDGHVVLAILSVPTLPCMHYKNLGFFRPSKIK